MFDTAEEAALYLASLFVLVMLAVTAATTLGEGRLADQRSAGKETEAVIKIFLGIGGLGFVLVFLAVLGFMYWSEHNPTERGAAQAQFDAAVAQTAAAGGQQFTAAAEEFLQADRLRRVELRAVRFQAYRRELGPGARAASNGWRGRLWWDERRQPNYAWWERNCSPVWVVLTTTGTWRLDGGRVCRFV